MLIRLSRTLQYKRQIKYPSNITFPWPMARYLTIGDNFKRDLKGRIPPEGISLNLEFHTNSKSYKPKSTGACLGARFSHFLWVYLCVPNRTASECWTASCCHKHVGNLGRKVTCFGKRTADTGKNQPYFFLLLLVVVLLLMQIKKYRESYNKDSCIHFLKMNFCHV